MRVFVAIPVDDETRDLLAQRVRDVVRVMPGAPVPPENWHLTLRFLGEIDDIAHDLLLGALDQAPLGPAFRLRWDALGAFPRASRAGVLWVGARGDEAALAALAAAVDDALVVAGNPPEDRPFRPHLTISRMRPLEDVRSIVAGAAPLDVPMVVERVAVFRSRLGRGGARYEVLEEFPLGS